MRQHLFSNTPIHKDIGKEENIVKNSQPIIPEQPDPMPEQMLIQEVTAPQKPHSFYTQSANSRFVRLNNEYINNLEKDDVFEITIPQTGITYPVLIHKKEQITEQDTLLEGRMSGYDENSSIQITYSPTHTFIVLNTPEGNYSIDAMGDLGIVRPASDYRYKEVQPLVSQVKAAPEPE